MLRDSNEEVRRLAAKEQFSAWKIGRLSHFKIDKVTNTTLTLNYSYNNQTVESHAKDLTDNSTHVVGFEKKR